jgi:hypothetical protein
VHRVALGERVGGIGLDALAPLAQLGLVAGVLRQRDELILVIG